MSVLEGKADFPVVGPDFSVQMESVRPLISAPLGAVRSRHMCHQVISGTWSVEA
jgi:hypothetical protein